ncbi:hypothetical protein OROHE_012273 [Orobanche hederae]
MAVGPKPFPSEPPPTRQKTEYDLSSSADADDDLYSCLKTLQRQHEFIEIQEEYVKDEVKNLCRELLRSQEEVKRIQSVTLVIGQFMKMIDQNNSIVGSTTGSNYYIRILSTINCELLKPSASVALHFHSNALVDVLPPEADSSISLLSQLEKPDNVFSAFGFVHKIATFEKAAGFQALIQYIQTASTTRDSLDGRSIPRYLLPSHVNECNLRISYSAHTDLNIKLQSHRSRDYTNPYLPVNTTAMEGFLQVFPPTVLGTGENWTLMKTISVTEYLNYEAFAKSAFDKALTEHEDIDDIVGSEESTGRDHSVDLQQPLLIKIDSPDSHQK